MTADGPIRRTLQIRNRFGLHARAAGQVVELAKRFEAEITLAKDGQAVNAKSILGLMMLAAAKGEDIEIWAEGPQAQAAVEALVELIERRFDEE